MLEKHRRSIIKAISWRVLATITTMLIVFMFTHRIVLSLGVGIVEVILKMVLYYLHERVWGRVTWGREKHPLEHLPVEKKLNPEDLTLIQEQLEALGYIERPEKEKIL